MDGDMSFSIFNQPKRSWEASKIQVKTDGKWWVFTDPNTNQNLNMRKKRAPDCHVKYRHQDQVAREPEPDWNPLDQPPDDNYNCFRVRKKLSSQGGAPPNPTRKPTSFPKSVDPPQRISYKYVHGDDPSKNPFRKNTKLVQTQRFTANFTPRDNIRSSRRSSRPQTARTTRPHESLFERSLKPKEINYEWPRDFYHFQSEEE